MHILFNRRKSGTSFMEFGRSWNSSRDHETISFHQVVLEVKSASPGTESLTVEICLESFYVFITRSKNNMQIKTFLSLVKLAPRAKLAWIMVYILTFILIAVKIGTYFVIMDVLTCFFKLTITSVVIFAFCFRFLFLCSFNLRLFGGHFWRCYWPDVLNWTKLNSLDSQSDSSLTPKTSGCCKDSSF